MGGVMKMEWELTLCISYLTSYNQDDEDFDGFIISHHYDYGISAVVVVHPMMQPATATSPFTTDFPSVCLQENRWLVVYIISAQQDS